MSHLKSNTKLYQFSDTRVERGCVANLNEPNRAHCVENDDSCKICHGDGCNKMVFFSSCIKCDSLSDSNCTIKPENCNVSICSTYEDVCFTYIGTFGIRRGCLNDESPEFSCKCDLNNGICKTCSPSEGINCNNVTIEIESCVDCDSRKHEHCHDQPGLYNSKVCNDLNAKGREGCYLEQVSNIVSSPAKILS